MNVYHIAGLTFAYAPQTTYTAAFLSEYITTQNDAYRLSVTPSAIDAERAFLPDAPQGVCEIAAILRELGRLAPAHDRLLIHAATVVFDGNAYAFIAPSGTGKTTHAQLWEQHLPDRAYILNGDKLFVHITDDDITAHGNPWRGNEHLGRIGSVPLRGIFALSRSNIAHCEPLSPADALPMLIRATPYPQEQEQRLRTLTLLETLATRIPLWYLHAPLSTDAVDAAVTAIGGTV